MVSENLMGKVVDEETYYLCMNEDCDSISNFKIYIEKIKEKNKNWQILRIIIE